MLNTVVIQVLQIHQDWEILRSCFPHKQTFKIHPVNRFRLSKTHHNLYKILLLFVSIEFCELIGKNIPPSATQGHNTSFTQTLQASPFVLSSQWQNGSQGVETFLKPTAKPKYSVKLSQTPAALLGSQTQSLSSSPFVFKTVGSPTQSSEAASQSNTQPQSSPFVLNAQIQQDTPTQGMYNHITLLIYCLGSSLKDDASQCTFQSSPCVFVFDEDDDAKPSQLV